MDTVTGMLGVHSGRGRRSMRVGFSRTVGLLAFSCPMRLRFSRQKDRLINWKLLSRSKPIEFLADFTIFFLFN